MDDQVGWRALLRNVKREAPYWAATMPQLPRLVHRVLADERVAKLEQAFHALHDQGRRRNRLLAGLLAVAVVWVAVQGWALFKVL
jgi:ubiquinone biosynthesis protein